MFYCFKYSTDRRVGVLEMKKTHSRKKAVEWKNQAAEYTFPEAAKHDVQPTYQNWHKNLYTVYEADSVPMAVVRKQMKNDLRGSSRDYSYSVYAKSYRIEAYVLHWCYQNAKQL